MAYFLDGKALRYVPYHKAAFSVFQTPSRSIHATGLDTGTFSFLTPQCRHAESRIQNRDSFIHCAVYPWLEVRLPALLIVPSLLLKLCKITAL